jgi:hypothetical protein
MKVRILKSSDVAACPKTSLLPAHYRDDGTCRCDETAQAQAEVAAARAAYTAACARLRRS